MRDDILNTKGSGVYDKPKYGSLELKRLYLYDTVLHDKNMMSSFVNSLVLSFMLPVSLTIDVFSSK